MNASGTDDGFWAALLFGGVYLAIGILFAALAKCRCVLDAHRIRGAICGSRAPRIYFIPRVWAPAFTRHK